MSVEAVNHVKFKFDAAGSRDTLVLAKKSIAQVLPEGTGMTRAATPFEKVRSSNVSVPCYL